MRKGVRVPQSDQLVDSMGEPGLDMLDDVRENFPQYSNIPTDRIDINAACPINGSRFEMAISEDTGREVWN